MFRWFSLSMAVLMLVAAMPAQAEVFVWQDEASKVSLSFPDRWQRGTDQQPDDVLTVRAPGDENYASCRMRVQGDRRFVIFPRVFDSAVQRTEFSMKFWEDYVEEFSDVRMLGVHDDAGLDRGFASYAEFDFTTVSGPKVEKRGFAFVSNYNDKTYVLECSAQRHIYETWRHPFLSVLKSVKLRDEYHANLGGHYRNFVGDGLLYIFNKRPEDLYTY